MKTPRSTLAPNAPPNGGATGQPAAGGVPRAGRPALSKLKTCSAVFTGARYKRNLKLDPTADVVQP